MVKTMMLKCLLLLLPVSTLAWTINSASNGNRYFPSQQGYAGSSSLSIYPPSGYRYSKSPAVDYYYKDDNTYDKNGYYSGHSGQSRKPRYQYKKSNTEVYRSKRSNSNSPLSSSSYNRPSSNSYYASNNGHYNDNYYNYYTSQQQGQIYPTSSYHVPVARYPNHHPDDAPTKHDYFPLFDEEDQYQNKRYLPYQSSAQSRQSWSPFQLPQSRTQRSSYGRSSAWDAPSSSSYGNQHYALSPDNVDAVTGLGKRDTYSSSPHMVRYQSPDVRSFNNYNNYPNQPLSSTLPTQQFYAQDNNIMYDSSSSNYSTARPMRRTRGYGSNVKNTENYYTSAKANRRTFDQSGFFQRPLQQQQRQW
jgi:hypothetical protein